MLEDSELTADLLRIHSILEGARRHFGYRVLNELMAYLGHAVQRVDGDHVARVALDYQLLQKVLLKLTGGRELQPTLSQLLDVCVRGETTAAPSTTEILREGTAVLGDETTAVSPGPAAARYPLSARKLRRMDNPSPRPRDARSRAKKGGHLPKRLPESTSRGETHAHGTRAPSSRSRPG